MDDQYFKDQALEIVKNKTTLMVSGGGVLGSSEVASIIRLEELGFSLKNIKKIKGSSVGSIISTAIACGANTDYMKKMLDSMDLSEFRDNDFILHSLYQLVFKYGMNKTDQIRTFISTVLTELGQKSDVTFLQLFEETGVHLIITYLSMNLEETVYADHLTEPNSLIREAVVKSSAIPLFYEGHFESLNGKSGKKNQTLAVDGGTLDNYSFNYLRDDVDPLYVLGLKLVSGKDMGDETNVGEENALKNVDKGCPKNVIEYFTRLIYLMRKDAMKLHVDKYDWMSSVKINVGTLTSTDFHITDKQKEWLFIQGKESVDKYIDELANLLKEGKYPYVK